MTDGTDKKRKNNRLVRLYDDQARYIDRSGVFTLAGVG